MAKKIKVGAVLTKAKHLDRCPIGTVIIDSDWRTAYQKDYGYDEQRNLSVAWWGAGNVEPYLPGVSGWGSAGGFRVLHVGSAPF